VRRFTQQLQDLEPRHEEQAQSEGLLLARDIDTTNSRWSRAWKSEKYE
jgi:hypothetical protein